jgi:hypothetical protein
MTNDRIRAKKPKKEIEKWNEGRVHKTEKKDYGYDVHLENGRKLSVTEAIYELFTGRLDSENPEDELIWYKNKS